jgi:hypothetical protein
VLSQCKRIARAIYSNPPVHGARIVVEVVGNEATFDEWRAEMEMMAGRIKVRQLLPGFHGFAIPYLDEWRSKMEMMAGRVKARRPMRCAKFCQVLLAFAIAFF